MTQTQQTSICVRRASSMLSSTTMTFQRRGVDRQSVSERSRQGGPIHIGVLTPHLAAGPEPEFAAMGPGRLVTAVARVSTDTAAASVTSGPPSPVAARALTVPPLLDDAAERLTTGSVDVIGYASTSSAYAIGFDDEAAMASRLSRRTGIPVAATCASAVVAVRVLEVDRIALVSLNRHGFSAALIRVAAVG